MRLWKFRLLAIVTSFSALLYAAASLAREFDRSQVKLVRTPDGGIQPQVAVDSAGLVHMVYFKGAENAGDIYYVRQAPDNAGFSEPIRVNVVAGSAIAVGSVRGPQVAVGQGGRVHVVWMGSDKARPRGPGNETSMLYTRLNDAGTSFEPERNVMQYAVGLDGGGSVAADPFGNVYVVWHGNPDKNGEANRRVWVARSRDGGKTFEREFAANREPTGACGCCALRAFADERGTLYILYRAATQGIHRDMVLLISTDQGRNFRGERIAKWDLNACPLTTAYISESRPDVLLAWQTEEQVYYARLGRGSLMLSDVSTPPGPGRSRKFPAIAGNGRRETLLAWTEGTAWKRGGSLGWQVFDQAGHPTDVRGTAPGVPVWGLVAAYSQRDAGFTIIY